MTLVKFPFEQRNTFMLKLNFLNKKLAEKNLPLIVIKKEDSVKVEDSTGLSHKWTQVILEGPSTLKEDCEYVGMILFVEGIRHIYSFDEEYSSVLGSTPTENLHCDHCNVNRKRNKYFFFKKEGKILSIGSSCAKEYFGWDIEKYLDSYLYVKHVADELADDFFMDIESRADRFIFLNDIIVATYMVTNKWQKAWVSKKDVGIGGKVSTASQILYILYPDKFDTETKKERVRVQNQFSEEMFSEVKESLIKKYRDMVPSSAFDYNLWNSLFEESGEIRDFVVSIGLVGYALLSAMHHSVEVNKKVSEFIGTVGEKITIMVTLINKVLIDGPYGKSILVTLKDSSENIFTAFSTSQTIEKAIIGNKYCMTGVIKDHKVYQDTKQTQLSRIKLENVF